jgi:hypothetical protein
MVADRGAVLHNGSVTHVQSRPICAPARTWANAQLGCRARGCCFPTVHCGCTKPPSSGDKILTAPRSGLQSRTPTLRCPQSTPRQGTSSRSATVATSALIVHRRSMLLLLISDLCPADDGADGRHLTERHWASFWPFGMVTETESPPSSEQAENTNEAATTRLMHRARRYRTLHYPCVLLRAGRGEPENGIQHKRGLPLGWLLSTHGNDTGFSASRL